MSLDRIHKISNLDPKWKALLSNIVIRLTQVDSNIEIKVFGSFVHDRMTLASDIDVAVIIPDSWKTKDFLEKLYTNGPISNWPVDLVVLRKSHYDEKKEIGGVSFDIYHEGIELYPEWKL